MPEDRIGARVIVDGVVQGVFFRAETRRMAAGLGLDGWVRNLPDGRVEAVFEGPDAEVRRAIQWVHHGPPRAEVTGVEVSWQEPEGAMGFSVR